MSRKAEPKNLRHRAATHCQGRSGSGRPLYFRQKKTIFVSGKQKQTHTKTTQMKFRYILAAFAAFSLISGCDDSLMDPDRNGQTDGREESGNGENGSGVEENPEEKYGWFELPAIPDEDGDRIDDNDPTLYYAYHICAGGEKDDKGRKARNYTVCYSAEHHCPVWVAAPRHAMYEEDNTERTDAYGKDPDIPADIQYRSKSTGDDCNKGHMLGSRERLSSKATNRQVFYYTNIAPQLSSTFNTGGGAWNNLEDHIDGLVCRDTLYEVVGCHFDKFTDAYGKSTDPVTISFGGRNDVSRPTMFYYALLRTKSGNLNKPVSQCTADELQCVAFCIRHTMEKGHEPQAKDMISITDLEKLTGFSYFTNVPNAPKDRFDPSDWL